MFGYIKINKPEMKVKEYEAYRGLYCSLCRSLGKNFGILSRLTLSYDITFLLLVRLSLSLTVPEFKRGRCPFNPSKMCNYCLNADEELRFSAAVSMMLFYYKVKDNIADGSFFRKILMYIILPYAYLKYRKAEKMYPEVAGIIEKGMANQRETEKSKTDLTDKAAHESADVLGKIFAYGLFDGEGKAYRFGYGIGKFVYLADAADDIEKDIKNKSYNPFVEKYKLTKAPDDEIKSEIEGTLNMCAAVAAEAFKETEKKTLTPIVENIIYDGLENTMKTILKGKTEK
ncbi:MAG: hypothetical protein IKB12_03730 [Clostridia bacterium]|nr:hypothetical protein [Clostridia bacterium]